MIYVTSKRHYNEVIHFVMLFIYLELKLFNILRGTIKTFMNEIFCNQKDFYLLQYYFCFLCFILFDKCVQEH